MKNYLRSQDPKSKPKPSPVEEPSPRSAKVTQIEEPKNPNRRTLSKPTKKNQSLELKKDPEITIKIPKKAIKITSFHRDPEANVNRRTLSKPTKKN
jgi:hypothetical protein